MSDPKAKGMQISLGQKRILKAGAVEDERVMALLISIMVLRSDNGKVTSEFGGIQHKPG